MSEEDSARNTQRQKEPFPDAVQSALDALQKLKFGVIQLTVHEGKLVQVDVTERKRFAS